MLPSTSNTSEDAPDPLGKDSTFHSSPPQRPLSLPASPRSSISPYSNLWASRLHENSIDPSPQSREHGPLSQFGPLSPSVTDRVFPIRSVVSVDPTATPYNRPDGYSGDGFPGMVPPHSANGTPRNTDERRFSTTSTASSNRNTSASNATIPSSQQNTEATISGGVGNGDDSSVAGEVRKVSLSAPGSSQRIEGTTPVQLSGDTASVKSESVATTGGGAETKSRAESIRSLADQAPGFVTARFRHVVTDGGHAVTTGRDGDVLQRCEDEPIHIPGAIQGFGLLIAMQEEAGDKLTVRIASENSRRVIGYTPKQLFELDSFCDILSDEQAENLLDHLDFIRDEDTDPATSGPEVFTLSIRSASGKMQKLWTAMHIPERNPHMIICEFELEDDQLYPLVPPAERTPEPPADTLHSNPTAEELAESTVNSSRPLRVLRSARKRKGEAAAMEVFNIMSQVLEQLASATNLDQFLKILVGVVKELTGFHRVMIYQFDQAFNGRVVTELVDPRATKDLYKGLNFPASDIPRQARELYKVNKVRLLYDRDLETARLVCRTLEDLETPLDLTHANLRAMSPIHLKYLANMAVRASMSISINAFGELWGLIACHSYGAKGMRVSFPIRKMCRLVGDSASRNIERLSYASRLQARKLINTAPTAHNPSGYIIASSDDLLRLFDADYGLLSIRGETKILGDLEHSQEPLAMLEYLRLRKLTSVLSSQDIRFDFPDLRYEPGFSVIAGLLLVPLSVGGADFIVFFRKGQMREVKWAGNPYEKFIKQGTEGYLEPRKSFKTWSETVIGKCREWTEEQIETAAVLCLVYGKFIEVWRQKEAALQNSQLTRLLLANSAHEVRTPLNAIINYLEIALEGALDQETRENLAKSHSASKSLIYVINDLLDLTKTEEGHDLIKDEVFDFPETAREATDAFKGDARRKQIEFQLIKHPGVPQFVVGDHRRVRQAISNLTANAIQNTSSGAVKVELWPADRADGRVEIAIVVQDTGAGMSPTKLDALFRELEQIQTGESDEALPEGLIPSSPTMIKQGKDEKRTLGLGLAVVARVVRNMNGQLRLKSEEGKGSRFVIHLGFDVPSNDKEQSVSDGANAAAVAAPAGHPTTPTAEEGEVMLVIKSTPKESLYATDDLVRKKSSESLKSFMSGSSGKSARSDVDRLINAIQEPHMVTGKDQRSPWSMRHGGHAERPPSSPINRPKTLSRPVSAQARGSSTFIESLEPSSLEPSSHLTPGKATVRDSGTPIRPVRMPEDEDAALDFQLSPRTASRVLFDVSNKPVRKAEPPTADHLQVLVAEDDPINSKIIKKRLEKAGHTVFLTVNGEECANAYGDKPSSWDIMPIVDGLTSTKMIRSYEKTHPSKSLSTRAALHGRVPVFAVSASLVEKDRQLYIDAGFDGWILKPVDFQRLSVLLSGIVEEKTRESSLYRPGEWERGGWFETRQQSIFSAKTAPSEQAAVSGFPRGAYKSMPNDPFDDPISMEQDRLDGLRVPASSMPENSARSGTRG
ncbi:MAG: ATPase of HSP90 chaperone DNA topoisomerase II histidine kinase [Lasallia pustulata]|uniref:ATPase of HSP90 chaperone DNA topoisomerase II histidine kinase n=1 Tax=Lasallia pustulata TaxID=136370 RepID=A0A5M8PWY0_9LECA|nr:MAG: ATPase of HSP90 chaperone DNA topoisomerase II histidine kinase [Lasallia pustulata]